MTKNFNNSKKNVIKHYIVMFLSSFLYSPSTITQKLLNYILYIQSKTEDSFVKQTFLVSFDIHSRDKSSFHSHLMKISKYFNLPDFYVNLLDIDTLDETQIYLLYTNRESQMPLRIVGKYKVQFGITTDFVCTCVCYRYRT